MTIARVPAPAPGVYPGVSMEEYHRWDCASNSALSRLMRSPAHLRAYLERTEEDDTPALQLGRAIHCAVLEPEAFDDRFTLAEPCGAELKSGNRKGERCGNGGSHLHRDTGWVCGSHAKSLSPEGFISVQSISAEDHRVCMGIRDSVKASRTAHGLISGPGQVELSMTWEDRGTGVLCKARWDRHSPEIAGGAIVDVKSTTDASPRSFERAILNFGYHRQAAFYLDGARARKLPARHFSIIAVEKEPPYAVAVYRITEGVIDAAAEQTQALLRLYAECRTGESWPGYPDEVRDLYVPDWAWKVMDEQTNEINQRSAA